MTGPTDAELAMELRRIAGELDGFAASFEASIRVKAIENRLSIDQLADGHAMLERLRADRGLVLLAADRIADRGWS